MAAETVERQPFAKGSIIWQRKGPLPVWAWMAIAVAVLLALVWWRRNRAAADAVTTTAGTELPGDQSAPPVFVVPQAPVPAINIQVPPRTVPGAPPGGGRPGPPPLPPPRPGAPADLPYWVNVKQGQIVDDWVLSLQRAGYKAANGAPLDWGTIATLNPKIAENVTQSNDPRKRVFRYDTAYKVR